jgi:hypothetical protein
MRAIDLRLKVLPKSEAANTLIEDEQRAIERNEKLEPTLTNESEDTDEPMRAVLLNERLDEQWT